MKAGLLGRKLGHSLSPQVHRFFGDYEYALYEREPEDVAAFVRDCDLDLLNITIPYKVDVAGLCDQLSSMAERLGNVNLVTRDGDGRIVGDNTDAYGVGRLLDSVGAVVKGRKCAILGAGGAAMTVKAVLEDRGASSVQFVRRGETPFPDSYLIVNATPVGMFPDVDGRRIDIASFPSCEVVLDLVYNPSPTRLVREARAAGKIAADGMVMLIAQAYRAFELAVKDGLDVADRKSLFLYGPPASGKSTWAKRIALATGMKLIDLDEEIVQAAGKPIPEIFANDGEVVFRDLESAALARVASQRGQVVALGGGALLRPENRHLVESSGRVVLLDCPLETLKARLTGDDRPLSQDPAKLEALVSMRSAHYASFPCHVEFSRKVGRAQIGGFRLR